MLHSCLVEEVGSVPRVDSLELAVVDGLVHVFMLHSVIEASRHELLSLVAVV